MLRILLVSNRREEIDPFFAALSSDPEISIKLTGSGAEALEVVRSHSPNLVIIDSGLADMETLSLVQELLMVDAMVNTAVVSPLSDQEFHEVSEGLGVLTRLPLLPGKCDAEDLMQKLRKVLGMTL